MRTGTALKASPPRECREPRSSPRPANILRYPWRLVTQPTSQMAKASSSTEGRADAAREGFGADAVVDPSPSTLPSRGWSSGALIVAPVRIAQPTFEQLAVGVAR